MEVCRLCLNSEKLIDVLKEPNRDIIVDLINLNTGIELEKTDCISTSICQECYILNQLIYKYRIVSKKNGSFLKQNTSKEEDCNILKDYTKKTFNSLIETNKNLFSMLYKSVGNNYSKFKLVSSYEDGEMISKPIITKTFQDKIPSIHPSVQEIQNKYKNLHLPLSCLKHHLNPTIELEKIDYYMNTLKTMQNQNFEKTPEQNSTETLYKEIQNCSIRRVSKRRSSTPLTDLSYNDRCSNCSFPNSNKKKLKLGESAIEYSNTKNINKTIEIINYKSFNDTKAYDSLINAPIEDQFQTQIESSETISIRQKNLENYMAESVLIQEKEMNLSAINNKSQILIKNVFKSTLKVEPPEEEINCNIDKQNLLDESFVGPSNVHDDSWTRESFIEDHQNLLSITDKNVNLYFCDICSKVFDTRKKLTLHDRFHSVCPYCKIKCKNATFLNEHWVKGCAALKPAFVVLKKLKIPSPPRVPKKSSSFALFDINSTMKEKFLTCEDSREHVNSVCKSTNIKKITSNGNTSNVISSPPSILEGNKTLNIKSYNLSISFKHGTSLEDHLNKGKNEPGSLTSVLSNHSISKNNAPIKSGRKIFAKIVTPTEIMYNTNGKNKAFPASEIKLNSPSSINAPLSGAQTECKNIINDKFKSLIGKSVTTLGIKPLSNKTPSHCAKVNDKQHSFSEQTESNEIDLTTSKDINLPENTLNEESLTFALFKKYNVTNNGEGKQFVENFAQTFTPSLSCISRPNFQKHTAVLDMITVLHGRDVRLVKNYSPTLKVSFMYGNCDQVKSTDFINVWKNTESISLKDNTNNSVPKCINKEKVQQNTLNKDGDLDKLIDVNQKIFATTKIIQGKLTHVLKGCVSSKNGDLPKFVKVVSGSSSHKFERHPTKVQFFPQNLEK